MLSKKRKVFIPPLAILKYCKWDANIVQSGENVHVVRKQQDNGRKICLKAGEQKHANIAYHFYKNAKNF
jgi:hypothetical protein